MSRNYRMRYHGISDPYVADPIKIIVNMPNGSQHVLLTEQPGETLLDVKHALLPHLTHDNPDVGIHHIKFWMRGNNGDIDDRTRVSTLALENPNVVELELLFLDPIQINLYTMSGKKYTIFSQRDDETILDVKRSLRPLLTFLDQIPNFNLDQIIFMLDDGNLVPLADNVRVSTLALDNVIDLVLRLNINN